MNYELAKKLKDAGFPQKEDMIISAENTKEMSGWEMYQFHKQLGGWHSTHDFDKPRPSGQFTREYLDSDDGKSKTVYIPNLSELIKACGDNFGGLFRAENNTFGAYEFKNIAEYGITHSLPEVAVANLWLKLHEHRTSTKPS